jgi:hypothetical protein
MWLPTNAGRLRLALLLLERGSKLLFCVPFLGMLILLDSSEDPRTLTIVYSLLGTGYTVSQAGAH